MSIEWTEIFVKIYDSRIPLQFFRPENFVIKFAACENSKIKFAWGDFRIARWCKSKVKPCPLVKKSFVKNNKQPQASIQGNNLRWHLRIQLILSNSERTRELVRDRERKIDYSLHKGTETLVRDRERFKIEGVRDRESRLYYEWNSWYVKLFKTFPMKHLNDID